MAEGTDNTINSRTPTPEAQSAATPGPGTSASDETRDDQRALVAPPMGDTTNDDGGAPTAGPCTRADAYLRHNVTERQADLGMLTPRERQVLALVATGMSNAEIAARLVLGEATAKTHLNRTMVKLGLSSRAQAMVIAYESGLVIRRRPGHPRPHPPVPTRPASTTGSAGRGTARPPQDHDEGRPWPYSVADDGLAALGGSALGAGIAAALPVGGAVGPAPAGPRPPRRQANRIRPGDQPATQHDRTCIVRFPPWAPVGRPAHTGRMRGVFGGEAAEREDMLAAAVVEAVHGSRAHAGSIFLRSRDRRSLVLAATYGVPPSLLGGWELIPVGSPIPVAVAYNSGRTVHLANAEETMRRYPQLSVALPYAFGSCSVPVRAGGESFGSLAILWSASAGGEGLSKAQRRHLRSVAGRLGNRLATLRARTGDPVECDPGTGPVETPAPSAAAVQVGLFDWNLSSGTFSVDDRLCAIFGLEPGAFDGRTETLASCLHPGDRAAFRACVREAVGEGQIIARRLRVRDHRGGGERYRTVELSGRVPEVDEARTRTHLVGAVVDAEAGGEAVAAAARLRDGLFSLTPDGRVTYANDSALQLLNVSADEVLGRVLWEVLPWLSDPSVEYRHRSAVISQTPSSFLASRPPDQWLDFSLHPQADGVTGRVVPTARPPSDLAAPASPATAAPATAPARLGVIYHVLQLSSALTEAVTTQQVCEVVSDQLLPAFAGQQMAIYAVRNGTMQLLHHTGHHEEFLDWLQGVPLHARLPGTETLTSGAPLFIESQQDLSRGYPGTPTGRVNSWAYLPLIASGRPIGTCVLGFDDIHHFTEKDRGILTALAGLVAQALERARLYDSEFAVAHGLQQVLLPHRLPTVPGIRTVARYLPATSEMDIGGDWYDVIPTESGACLVIGDVEGHSIAAAATMAQLRSMVRAFTAAGHTPGDVMTGVNDTLIDLDSNLLASCCYIRLEPHRQHAYAVTAGHPPPLLRRPDGTTDALHLDAGPVLGVDHASAYTQTRIALPPGSVLALYTDGLVEEPGTDIDVGIDRLRAALAHARADSLDELADRLLHQARGSSYRADDIALLLTEHGSSHGPRDPSGRPSADRHHDFTAGH